jgi:hypothetical protein
MKRGSAAAERRFVTPEKSHPHCSRLYTMQLYLVDDWHMQHALPNSACSKRRKCLVLTDSSCRGALAVEASAVRGTPVDESEFLVHLEYRICGELRSRGPLELRGLWCDGLELHGQEEFMGRVAVFGTAYMMDGPKVLSGDGRWTFRLMLPQGVARDSVSNWRTFLPPEEARGWLETDLQSQTLTTWLSRWCTP